LLMSISVAELCDVEDIVPLKFGLGGHLKPLKWYHSKAWYGFFYSNSIVTTTMSCIVSEIKRDIGRKSRFIIPNLHFTQRPIFIKFGHDTWIHAPSTIFGNNLGKFSIYGLFVPNKPQNRRSNGTLLWPACSPWDTVLRDTVHSARCTCI